jgi:hypothetical protein
MRWLDFFKKIKLVEVQNTLKTDQAGLINFQIEGNTYHLYFPDEEAVARFKSTAVTRDFEAAVEAEVRRRLGYLGPTLDALSTDSMRAVVSGSTTASALDLVKK